jgi:tRNA A37 methylthiotransferase MiaB
MLDGALIGRYLESNDWQLVGNPEEADLIIVNSCGVTEGLEQRSLRIYRDMMAAKRVDARVIFAGCLPAINKQAVRAAGYDDVLVTPRRLHVLDTITDATIPLDSLRSGCVPISSDGIGLSFTPHRGASLTDKLKGLVRRARTIPVLPIPRWLWQVAYYPDQQTEFVRISVGCMDSCSFCSIPKAKGTTKSVPLDEVVARVERAIARGRRSLALSCDELGSYGQDRQENIVALLDRVTSVPGEYFLSLRNVHPAWLLRYWSELRTIFARGKIRYIVLPLQSGSDRVLTLMKRNHSAEEYRWLVEQIRETAPRTILRTHVLVGFPGESADDFRRTYQFLRRLRVDSFYVHRYSERSFTPSANLPDKVPADVIEARARRLEWLQRLRLMQLHTWLPLRP